MTATVIQSLLEIVGTQLRAVYGRQFVKLMQSLIGQYLPKIHSITPAKHAGAVKRLELFLRDKFLTGR